MLERSYMEKILDYAVCHGADYGEVYYEDARRSNLVMLNDEITSHSVGREKGIGIRMFRENESYYFYSSDVSEKAVFSLLHENWKEQQQQAERNPLGFLRQYGTGERPKEREKAEVRRKQALLTGCLKAGRQEDSCIVQARGTYLEMDQKVELANTEGVYVKDRRKRDRLHLTMYAQSETGEREQSYTGPGTGLGIDYFDCIDIEEIAKNTARDAKKMLGAKPCPAGKMEVVIGNGFGGLFFHEACGHSLEASGLIQNGSEFSNQLGKKVASAQITLIDDGKMAGQWGSLGVDDEGILPQRNVLIENGILKGYLVDRFSGRRLGLAPTGSARRQNYRYAPTARMTNTYIAPGAYKPEELIHATKRGIYVKNINAGSVDPITGAFNFNTSENYLIENGKIICPLTNATLIGTGSQILHKIDMVADDYKMGQGFCYAKSGALFIGAGQPTVRITDMTVGGKQI